MSNETEVEVDDVASYIKYINGLSPTINGDARTYESTFVFRGQGSTKFDLVPSIGRDSYRRELGSDTISLIIGSLTHEADIIETACRIMPNIFKRDLLPIDLLACLQHYGVPTRLLDVTSNALAALYFACGNPEDVGEVFIFRRPGGDKREYPICQAIADSWHLFLNSKILSHFASLAISRPYFDYQRDLVLSNCPEPTDQAKWFKKCCEDTLFVYGTRYLDRQAAQSGQYILFPNDIRGKDSSLSFDDLISPLPKDSPVIAGRCIVPSNRKASILNELSKLGITEASLFPDSIEKRCAGIVSEIKRHRH
ncbi:FRG domain-containing protein [Collinsella sp. AF14-35]|uniref:FRG domain-containing protein n=1 Tax=Collinsella sp. AF14-35 TaxID=2292213 RepID=UPI000E554AE7|nr:FRG domain-containing protein [Collinsella sp. AF14-35]RGV40590.1 FRG domain-containing protein [Collinsella sp. AF14-35]